MAIFSVFHLWAYPWSAYDVRQARIATSEPNPRVALEPATSYSGGPFGIYAFLDAFVPWDMVKGVGRGFKWFIVGRRMREQDTSYTNSGRAIVLRPVRKVFALQFPLQEDGVKRHLNLSQADNGSRTCIGASSANDHSLANEEKQAVKEDQKSLLSQAQSNSPTGSFLQFPPKKHQIVQTSNQASTNDNSTIISPSECITKLQEEPCSSTSAFRLSLPDFHALKIDFREENLIPNGEHLNLAPPLLRQAQYQSSSTNPAQQQSGETAAAAAAANPPPSPSSPSPPFPTQSYEYNA